MLRFAHNIARRCRNVVSLPYFGLARIRRQTRNARDATRDARDILIARTTDGIGASLFGKVTQFPTRYRACLSFPRSFRYCSSPAYSMTVLERRRPRVRLLSCSRASVRARGRSLSLLPLDVNDASLLLKLDFVLSSVKRVFDERARERASAIAHSIRGPLDLRRHASREARIDSLIHKHST